MIPAGHIVVEALVDALDTSHHFRILEHLFKTLGGEALQEHHRVFTCCSPHVGIDVAEKVLSIAVPDPP